MTFSKFTLDDFLVTIKLPTQSAYSRWGKSTHGNPALSPLDNSDYLSINCEVVAGKDDDGFKRLT